MKLRSLLAFLAGIAIGAVSVAVLRPDTTESAQSRWRRAAGAPVRVKTFCRQFKASREHLDCLSYVRHEDLPTPRPGSLEAILEGNTFEGPNSDERPNPYEGLLKKYLPPQD